MNLPPRYAQTLLAHPRGAEELLHRNLTAYLRMRRPQPDVGDDDVGDRTDDPLMALPAAWSVAQASKDDPAGASAAEDCPSPAAETTSPALPPLSRKQISTLLAAAGSHPRALAQSLENILGDDVCARPLIELARSIDRGAKDQRLLELLEQSPGGKLLIFANFRKTLDHLAELLQSVNVPYAMFTGAESAAEKDAAVDAFRERVPVLLCSESGGEGRNLQFANTLVNYDLPWNPMRIEQRVGRIHRIGQTREVFIFNLCAAGSLEAQILDVLNEKIRMFELVVGEVGSILGNLEGGEEFETLVLNLWLRSRDEGELQHSFAQLGHALLEAQEDYLQTKEFDDALFGDDFE